MIQKWVGIGRLGQDAENFTLQSGATFIKFSIVVDDPYQDKNGNWIDRSYWIPIEMQSKGLVDYYNGRLTKGTLIWIEGKLATYKIQDQQTGANITKFVIIASGARIISRPQISNSTGYNNNNYQTNNNQNTAMNTPTPTRQTQRQPTTQPQTQNINQPNIQPPQAPQTQTQIPQAPQQPQYGNQPQPPQFNPTPSEQDVPY